jgi:hypothetical protein
VTTTPRAARATLVAAAALAGGCSSTGPRTSTDSGHLALRLGIGRRTCLGQPISNDLTGQTFTLSKGTSSDLLSTWAAAW